MENSKITIFYSYAKEDQKWQEELEKRLSRPRANITIEHLHRNQINGGDSLTDIESYIDQADIIFLLLSPDFMYEKGHYNSLEVNHIRKRYLNAATSSPSNANKTPRVIPVHVRPTRWDGSFFADQQFVLRNGKALTSWSLDEAWQRAMFEIDPVIEDFTTSSEVALTNPLGATQPFISKMPPQNPFFTGRDALLRKLWDRFTRQKATSITHKQALLGLGGIGKTQLAVRYVDLYRAYYKYKLWVNAATRSTLIQGYVEIARSLALPEQDAKDQGSVVKAVMQWLETNTGWLLVMDNADQIKMVQEFIPARINGHLLLTTRAQAVGEIAETLKIENMPKPEGALFLLLRARKLEAGQSLAYAHKEDRENAEKIVDVLGGLPLALDQAGAYIEENQGSLGKYLELYQQLGISMLSERSDLSRSHPHPVTTTFRLNFTEVNRSKTNAADVLRLCAFLAPDAIPEKLLTAYLSTLSVNTATSSQTQKASRNPLSRQKPQESQPLTPAQVSILLNEASKVLLRYSLIHRDDRAETFAIHQLMQAVLRATMDENEQRRWAERAVRIVGVAFPGVEAHRMNVDAWPACEELLPHVIESARLIKRYRFSFPEASRLLNDVATYLTERGRYQSAVPWYREALFIRQATGGHLYAQSLYNLGRVYERLARYNEAGQHLREALDIQEQELGENHPDIVPTLNSLAALYKIRGKPQKAGELYERAFQISLRSPDPEQFYLSEDFFDQIEFYRLQRNKKKTKELYKDALEKIKQKRGEDHPNVAKILHAWGDFSTEQGDFAEAAELLQRALEIRKKWFGDENADTASTLHSIAELHERQGDAEGAEKLYQQALSMREKALGADHPETAASLYSLARLYRAQDKIVEAEKLYQKALSIRQKKFGPDHPSTLESQRELADFYKSQGRLAEAGNLYKRGLKSGYLTLQPDDHAILQNLRELVGIYTLLEKHEEVEQLYDEAFTQRSNRLGINHPSTEQSLQDLLRFYSDRSDSQKEALLYQRTFELRARKLRGDDHASLQKFERNMQDLSSIYDRLKLPQRKLYLYRQADRICSRILGVRDRLARYCRNEWMKLGENPRLGQEVEESIKGELAANKLEFTADLPNTIADYQQAKQGLAGLLEKQHRIEEAEKILKQGLTDVYRTLGFNHPVSVESRHELVQFYEDHEMFAEAKNVYLVAIEYCKMKLEPLSPHFLECRNDLISLYLRHKKYKEANTELKEMLLLIGPLQEEQPIPEHYTQAIVRTWTNAASLYQQIYKQKRNTAELLFEQALSLSAERLGKKHPETTAIRQRFINFLREIGKEAKATAIEIDAITMGEADQDKQNEQNEQIKEDETPLQDEETEFDEDDIE